MNRIIGNELAAAFLMGAAAGLPRQTGLDVGSAEPAKATDADRARLAAAQEKRNRRNAKRAALAKAGGSIE